MVAALSIPERLPAHLRTWLGAWPPARTLEIATAPTRTAPGWDGAVHPFVGVATPEAAVLSVPPDAIEAVAAVAADLAGLRAASADGRLAEALGRAGARLFEGVFRWSEDPAPLDDAGQWVPVGDPRVPPWLVPFGGEVLMAFDDAGEYVAGVGIKVHDEHGHELAVVTEERAREKGLARRLVAQAARRVLDVGAVPTYLHADSNVRSAKVAVAAGFPERGWRILGVAVPPPATEPSS
jgi:GNAT superfamily N-acetyltransferase